jgi:hypothetical protein
MQNKCYIMMLLLLTVNLTACTAPKACFRIKVIDTEAGMPIEGGKVKFRYNELQDKPAGQGWGTTSTTNNVIKLSDANGIVTDEGRISWLKQMGISISKDGYYSSGIGRDGAKKKNSMTHNIALNRWEPWPCEVMVKLKKIKDPVPMFQKHTDWLNIPKQGNPVGFDLEVGDWVVPHGKGKVSDFIFNLTARFKSPFDSEAKYEMTFSDLLNGIQEFKADPKEQSVFKYPYQAPETGYIDEMSRFEFNDRTSDGENVYKTDMKENREYFYRVRTKTDAQGNIISANYGYLTSELAVQRFKGGRIKFTYYFNPDNQSRSLEYNGVNLFDSKEEQAEQYEKFHKQHFSSSKDK